MSKTLLSGTITQITFRRRNSGFNHFDIDRNHYGVFSYSVFRVRVLKILTHIRILFIAVSQIQFVRKDTAAQIGEYKVIYTFPELRQIIIVTTKIIITIKT